MKLFQTIRTCALLKYLSIARHYPRRLCKGILISSFMAASAQAAFQPMETFDALALGNISGQNGWVDTGNSGNVVLDPAGGLNQALKVNTESGVLYRETTVLQDDTRMLFLRFRFEDHGRYSFGLTRATIPAEYSDFSPVSGQFFLDDIYLENTSALNLSNPTAVPVPAALWLFGSGLLGLAGTALRRHVKAAS